MKLFLLGIQYFLLINKICFVFFAAICSAQTQDTNIKEQTQFFKEVTEPVNEAILSSPVDGTVKEILFKEGDWVEKGDPIIKFDRREEELTVSLRYKVWMNKASLDAAKIEEENLLALFNSTKRLFEKNRSVSKDELTNIKVRYDQSHYKRIELETREEQERIQYEMANEMLAKRILYAPIKAIITNIFLNKGERCKSNENLIKLVDPRVCCFKCNVEERLAYNLVTGRQVLLQIQTGKNTVTKTGEVVFVSPIVDPASGLMKIKVLFENSNLLIRPGVSGKMILKPEQNVSTPRHTPKDYSQTNQIEDKNKAFDTLLIQSIMDWIKNWREAWLNQNMDKYLSYYIPKAKQGKIKGIDNIRKQKTNLWKNAGPKDIRIEDIKIEKKDSFVQAIFIQKYKDITGYHDIGKKTLLLMKNGNKWSIVNEIWEKI